MNFKNIISNLIEDENVKAENILLAPKPDMGDFCLPCFTLAKTLHKSPQLIAQDFQAKVMAKKCVLIEKTEIVGGYLNFFLNKSEIAEKIVTEYSNSFSIEPVGKGKTVCLDYCSPNLAKYLHVGHFSTCVLGESLQRIYRALGYNVVRINYIGDYGTTFGKMVVAVRLWSNVEEIVKGGIDKIQDLYVNFAKHETEDMMVLARHASKNIEDKNGEDYRIYKIIIEISLSELKKILDRLDIKFDDWRGESFYNEKIPTMIKELQDKNVAQKGVSLIKMENKVGAWEEGEKKEKRTSTIGYSVPNAPAENGTAGLNFAFNVNSLWNSFNYTFNQMTATSGLTEQTIRVENNATIVDLNKYHLNIAVVERSDGGSVYITRDLCAIKDRYEHYKFDEMLYVVAVQQKLHFEQLFKICELMGYKFYSNCKHISYGMFSTPEGKIASRKGKQALLIDMLNEAENSARDVIKDKEFVFENKNEVARKVAKGAISFSILKVERNKDKIFDLSKAISFDGETAPYLQYTYARCCSLLRKFEEIKRQDSLAECEAMREVYNKNFNLFLALNNFKDVVYNSWIKAEPCLIARELINLSQIFNKFYHDVKIVDTNNLARTNKLIQVVKAVKNVLGFGMPLVLVDTITEM